MKSDVWLTVHLKVTAQYQHVAITLRSRQLLKMGTWLPETCWATCKGEIKDSTKVTSSWFLIHTKKNYLALFAFKPDMQITQHVNHSVSANYTVWWLILTVTLVETLCFTTWWHCTTYVMFHHMMTLHNICYVSPHDDTAQHMLCYVMHGRNFTLRRGLI